MKIVYVKCPSCKKVFEFNKELKNAYCNYCGEKISDVSSNLCDGIKSKLIINRLNKVTGSINPFIVNLDGKDIGELKNGSSVKYDVEYGTHILELRSKFLTNSTTRSINEFKVDSEKNIVFETECKFSRIDTVRK